MGFEEVWHYDLVSGSRSLPVILDYNGDGTSEIVITTRFDSKVWIFGADGSMLSNSRETQWLGGSIASAAQPGVKSPFLAIQESAGRINLLNYDDNLNLSVVLEGDPQVGNAPCFADLDMDGYQELICTRRDGVVTAFDKQLTPKWQFDAGATFDSSPAAAPVFHGSSAVYVQTKDGVLHCVNGDGRPLWHFRMAHPGPRFPPVADPILAQLAFERPSVLVSDKEGWLYAIDAVSGQEQWRVQIGNGRLGSPAIIDVYPNDGYELVAVDEQGAIAVLSGKGELLQQAKLPEAEYLPRPLVADVDGDGQPEVLLATEKWTFVIATLDGRVKEQVDLVGNVKEGMVMADLDGNGYLELIAATNCARVYCFTTRAESGWTHPRANQSLNGYVPPVSTPVSLSPPQEARKSIRLDSITVTDFSEGNPFATAVLKFDELPKAGYVSAVIRQQGSIVGSASKRLTQNGFAIPFVHLAEGGLTLDLALYGAGGELLASSKGTIITTEIPKSIELPSPRAFLDALSQRGDTYGIPESWHLPKVLERDSWHVARFIPGRWKRFGIAEEPFIDEAMPRLGTSATRPRSIFRPEHRAWPILKADSKPFFVMNDYFRPELRYPDDALQAILGMAGERFLGFPVHEWGYYVWKITFEASDTPPASRKEATAILKADFDQLMDKCHGMIYQGQGYCLFHHQAFEWGAPMGYAEIGENIPCTPLQFAFLRGASRQYGGRPWGAYLSNWFRGAVLDSQYRTKDRPRIRWSQPNNSSGPDCGHSPSIEFRFEMAAYLAGATFVHHESDGHNSSIFIEENEPDVYSLSPFGAAMKTWYEYSRQYPDRGVPYTPIAFMVDFHHGWRPREYIYGIWPLQRPDRSMEAIFRHVYPYGGHLDFERGYLVNGPYGDIFDVVTNNAPSAVLQSYAVIWPIGKVEFSRSQRKALISYVKTGGILVLDSALAQEFPSNVLGVSFGKRIDFAKQVRTALSDTPPPTAPYLYQQMKVGRKAHALAWTETGDAILAWHRVGKGMVVVAATDHWLDQRERLLPIVNSVLSSLTDALLPFRISGDVEKLINRTNDGWVIGLINNNGVTKVPTCPAIIDSAETRDCTIRFGGRVSLEFISRMGEFRRISRENSFHTNIPPGGVAVVEVKYQ